MRDAGVEDTWEWKWKGAKKGGAFAKLKELKIDAELFWSLEDGQLKDDLEIKNYGIHKKLCETIK